MGSQLIALKIVIDHYNRSMSFDSSRSNSNNFRTNYTERAGSNDEQEENPGNSIVQSLIKSELTSLTQNSHTFVSKSIIN